MQFNEIPKLVINLPQRTDRLKLFNQEIKFIGNPCVQLVSGIIDPNPMKGIGQAHINCILIAKQSEWDNVLIMEDDVVFNGKENTLNYINIALQNAPNDWDILLGGIYFGSPKKHNEYWSYVKDFCGLHFYIVNSKAYDKILEYNFKMHIDRWMGSKVKCYVSNQFFATQREGFSDNTKKKEDYTKLLKKYKLL